MALSNIFREPRREITESIVGLAAFGVFAWGDYHFALWFYDYTGGSKIGCPWPIGMLIGAVFLAAAIGIVVLTHAIGDRFCNWLEDRGVHLRPRNRR